MEGKKLLSQTTIKKLPVLPLLHGGNLDKESPFLLGVHLDWASQQQTVQSLNNDDKNEGVCVYIN